MIKFAIIGAYIAHKVYWKRQNKIRVIKWSDHFKKVN